MIKVVKFGGSSLASAEQFRKAGDIVKLEKERKYVIPSAPGKRSDQDMKVTDMLYDCYSQLCEDENSKDYMELLNAIKNRYKEIVKGLSLKLSMDKEFKVIEENFHNRAGVDYAASRGEYLNGLIMAEYLSFEFVDAAEIIAFDAFGHFDPDKTDAMIKERLLHAENAVIPGFYGAMPDGTIKTFSRGGSDITGSIVSRAVSRGSLRKLDGCFGISRCRSTNHSGPSANRHHYLQRTP